MKKKRGDKPKREEIVRDAYAACMLHAKEKHEIERTLIMTQMERSIEHDELAEALGMSFGCDIPCFREMISRVKELRLTLKRMKL